jgi:hypothetical protein
MLAAAFSTSMFQFLAAFSMSACVISPGLWRSFGSSHPQFMHILTLGLLSLFWTNPLYHNNSAGKRARPKPTWGRSSERGPHASEPSDRSGRSGDGALRAVAPQRQRNARDTGSRDDERLTDPWVHWPEKCFVRCGHIAVARLAPMASPAVGESLLSSQSPPGFRPRLSLRGAPRPA